MATISLDHALTLQDKVRLYLGENMRDNKYVPLTTDSLAAKLGVGTYEAYQTLARLNRRGEIVIEKDTTDNRIVGVTVHKLEPSGRTYSRAAERAKETVQRETEDYTNRMTNLQTYLNQKLAVLRMQEQAKEAGLDPENTIVFEENPFAEEGLLLLSLLKETFDKLSDAKKQAEMLNYDLEAAKRDNDYLKRNSSGGRALVGASN